MDFIGCGNDPVESSFIGGSPFLFEDPASGKKGGTGK